MAGGMCNIGDWLKTTILDRRHLLKLLDQSLEVKVKATREKGGHENR